MVQHMKIDDLSLGLILVVKVCQDKAIFEFVSLIERAQATSEVLLTEPLLVVGVEPLKQFFYLVHSHDKSA
jgi:hypothetical protein